MTAGDEKQKRKQRKRRMRMRRRRMRAHLAGASGRRRRQRARCRCRCRRPAALATPEAALSWIWRMGATLVRIVRVQADAEVCTRERK
jgi:hypothetical protein